MQLLLDPGEMQLLLDPGEIQLLLDPGEFLKLGVVFVPTKCGNLMLTKHLHKRMYSQ